MWTPGGLALCTAAHGQYQPVAAADGAGGAFVAWEDQRTAGAGDGNQLVVAQKVDAGGAPQWASDGVVVTDGHSASPRVLSDGAGGAFVTWGGDVRFSPTEWRPALLAQRLGTAGQRLWTDPGFLLYHEPTGHYGFFGPLVDDGAGGFIVHWLDYRYSGGGETDIFAQRVSDSVSPPLVASADLSVTLTVAPDPVEVGANLTCTATIANAGPGPATLVAANAETPPATSLRVVTPSQGTCVPWAASCNLGTIAAGSSVKVTYLVRPSAPIGPITSTIYVASNTTDPDLANNHATVDTAVMPTTQPPPTSFYTVTPCRILDTRDPDGPSAGRRFTGSNVVNVAGLCGIPRSALSASVNLTVTESTGPGHVTLYSLSEPQPTASNLNFVVGQTRANSAVVGISDEGRIVAYVGPSSPGLYVHLILDVTGYFQ